MAGVKRPPDKPPEQDGGSTDSEESDGDRSDCPMRNDTGDAPLPPYMAELDASVSTLLNHYNSLLQMPGRTVDGAEFIRKSTQRIPAVLQSGLVWETLGTCIANLDFPDKSPRKAVETLFRDLTSELENLCSDPIFVFNHLLPAEAASYTGAAGTKAPRTSESHSHRPGTQLAHPTKQTPPGGGAALHPAPSLRAEPPQRRPQSAATPAPLPGARTGKSKP
jgi:hypothetical protein